ncbi:fatty acyl-CoA reductase wat-like isoform X2 [Battus philenor]|uniref:fatty acyl-CoA reductase wat-like isoform X2 n=1 Tax=Battus philenor TaxID=42288 RepID=UPI0035D08D42
MDNLKNLKQSMQAQQEKLKEFVTHGDSAIQKFYENSSVFITGGTGFIGKLLIEKLSRACSLNKIYVLIRSKKNKSIKQRILELMDDPVFDVIKSEQPNFGSKIIPIEGDITEYRLGLSKADWNTISDEVDTIFHMAANIRFDVELKEALLCNVRGTREAVQLGKDCKKLRAFVYVSTAYTYATEDRVGCLVSEDIQTPPMESELLVNMAETMSSETLDKIAPVLVNGWPNTYTYTKAVAEEVVRSLGNDLPICVVRPGIVIATYMEPIAGWIDESNVYGPTGLLLGSGLGLVKVLCANRKNKVNIVPGDLVTNAIIAAGWETGSQRETKPLKPEVYTLISQTN